MAEIVDIANRAHRAPVSPDVVLEEAKGCDPVLVVGFKDGELYVAASRGDQGFNFLLAHHAARYLMDWKG